ncbi:hypothetical protein [Nannocystis punicea]|uniref:DUF4149 domain-containing protein n=1 Tax=Nannocystis punicea TaxID=2995304 RepID=A0ABY7HBP7_9BACT|nr:hypothetical protein [Nannocystis poenicansa]WAS96701.1 hypothetical protein O0S08_11170 [Nannocystis poenicansa]
MLPPISAEERRVLAARAAVLVLGVVVSWPILGGLAAGLEYALFDVPRGVIPSFTVRATLSVGTTLLELVVLLLVVHLASREPRAEPRPLSVLGWIALAVFVGASVGGSLACIWLPARVAQAIDTLGVERLGAWVQETTELTLLQFKLHGAAVLAGFVYAVVRWQSAVRRSAVGRSRR